MSLLRWIYVVAAVAVVGAGSVSAQDLVRNFGAVDLSLTPDSEVSSSAMIAESAVAASGDPAAVVAFGHRRNCYNCAPSFSAAYYAYNTWQPTPRYASGYGAYGVGYQSGYAYSSPNPYGYYPNGEIWGSSGPTYARPMPVWDSPSGRYDYRYNGWGSYGWGGWGGTGPAGWGYQGGFYW